MADSTTVKPSLQKHEKDLKTLEGRMDHLQEVVSTGFERAVAQMEAMGSQIAQISQKL